MSLDGGVWEPGNADINRFMAAITEHSRTLHVEGEDGESHQAVLSMGALPTRSQFPGEAELLFSPLESLDYPVDAVAHVQAIPNRTMQTRADNAVKDARNEVDDASTRILDWKTEENLPRAKSIQHYFAKEPYPPCFDVCTSFAVGAPDSTELASRIKRLRRAFGSVRLFQSHALQPALYNDHLLRPDGATVRDYRRLMNREQLAGLMPLGSNQAGAARGIFIAHTIPGAKRPVVYNPLEASQANRAGAVLMCGTLGAGKTIALELMCYQSAHRGSLVVDIDPKPDHELENLPGLKDRVHVISLADVEGNRGLLDPMVVAPEELREELASGYMMEILPDIKHEWQTEIIDAVRTVLRTPRPSSWRVVEHLLASDDPHAHAAGKALRVWSDWGLGKLAFGSDDRAHLDVELPVTTIKASALTLPPVGTNRSNYDQAERISVATLKLIAAYAMRLISRDRSVHKMLVLDEAHVLTATADGRRFLERLIRMGRSMNITVMLASQLLGDLSELEELIGVRFSFRQETDEQARANLKMLGLDPSNEKLVAMLRNFSEGGCLMRGLDGRVAAVRFDPADPEFLKAADTNPTKPA